MIGDEEASGAEERDQVASFPTLDERSYSRGLQGGLAILACFTEQRPVLGTSEIAEMLGMTVGSANRFILTLAEEGYLEQAAGRKYRLSLRATELGMASINETGLCRHARPYLEELADATRCTAALGVLDGPEILLVDVVASSGGGQRGWVCESGTSVPAHCTAIGKVLLAYLPPEQRVKVLAARYLQERGPRTITTRAELLDELADVRQEGLAVNDEELRAGICEIAAPVRDQGGDVVAAVGLAGGTGAIGADRLAERFAGQLLGAADRISARLGWLGEAK